VRLTGVLLACVAASCGGPRAPVVAPAPEEPVEEAGGVRLLALPRPAEGMWLSLFVDAGARDASPPRAATVATWAAAPEGVQARVLADHTELSMPCERPRLAACVERLAQTLATRSLDADRVAAANERLRAAQRGAIADPRRTADRLALTALLGEGVDPVGRPGDDAIAASVAEAFLADSFGPERALVVAAGDVDAAALRQAAEHAFAAVPPARRSRAERSEPRHGTGVDVASARSVSIATTFESDPPAIAGARRWVGRLGESASAEVFPVRGATVLLLRADGAPADVVERARLLLEETLPEGVPIPESDPRAAARRRGARWARGEPRHEGGLGVGVVVDGGRGDELTDDPDAALRERTRREVEAALDEGPLVSGELADEGGAVVVDHLVHIDGRRAPTGDRVDVRVSFEGGAMEETDRTHGLTGTLAHALLARCIEAAPATLGSTPEALGIEIRPDVEPGRFGWTVSGPRARWAEITWLAGRCGDPAPWPVGLLDRLRPGLPRDVGLAAVAGAISPGSPGRIAPWPATPSDASPDDLTRWQRRVVTRRRAWIVVRGDLPLRAPVLRLARLSRAWPEGDAPESEPWSGPARHLYGVRGSPRGAWIVWTTRGTLPGDALDELVVAYRDALAQAGLEPIDQRRGYAGGTRWVAYRVTADESVLDALPERAPPAPDGAGPRTFVMVRPAR